MTAANIQAKQGMVSRILRLAPIRLILFLLVLVAAYLCAQVALSLIAQQARTYSAEAIEVAAALALSAALLGVYVLLVRWIERRQTRELAAFPGFPLAIGGASFGFALFCLVYAVLWAVGVAHWQGVSPVGVVISPLIMAVVAAIGEELAIRGGVFRILEDSCGTAVALILSAGLFGLLHMLNNGATTVSTVAIALEAGVLLGAAYAVSRNLWLPIGLHFGWNFTEGGVFGAVVSGGSASTGVVNMPLSGPDLLTGGAFGPEASLVAVAICLAAGLILIAVTIRQGRWVPLSFHLMLD
jgi:membrane protease YdiL (CAAX protease family)